MNYTEISSSLNDLGNIIERYKTTFKNNIILLNGELGTGKTTFVKKFVETFSPNTTASSPTFTIMQRYETSVGPVYHFDLYRIETLEELEMTGFFEYLDYSGTIFIEWAEKFDIGRFLDNFITINITQMENGKRKYAIEVVGGS